VFSQFFFSLSATGLLGFALFLLTGLQVFSKTAFLPPKPAQEIAKPQKSFADLWGGFILSLCINVLKHLYR
jgi:hypothetical protein